MAMRVGPIVSVAAHVAIIAWGFVSLPWPKPIDASDIEQIPVDFVTIADDTQIAKGLKTADLVADKPTPPPPADKAEDAPPLPKPAPLPDPTPTPPPPPPPPDPTPAPPTPQPDPTPPPPQDTPPAPSPDATTPPPPEPTPAPPQPMKDVPLPHVRPTPPKPKPPAPTQDNTSQEMDQIATLLDQAPPPAPSTTDATPPVEDKQTVGSVTGLNVATLTASELDALKSKILSCFHPPPGWADSQDGDVVLMLDLNQDGTLADAPSVVQTPQGQYSNTATESASRAVRLCQPYDMLSADKYDVWKQVRVVFKPSDVGGA